MTHPLQTVYLNQVRTALNLLPAFKNKAAIEREVMGVLLSLNSLQCKADELGGTFRGYVLDSREWLTFACLALLSASGWPDSQAAVSLRDDSDYVPRQHIQHSCQHLASGVTSRGASDLLRDSD